ncbi:hypothetical protein M9Y10_009759 [Tritrichomonas musculus]|uniref:Auto-transporter adhesin head GIN domain-containing protein n=1 Tax=Tritrichomonas musculus TaxID=1915356 RepID=A0ABR2IQR8_9EUKA
MCSICSSNYSYCSFCSGSYVARNGLCINSDIEAVEPPTEQEKEELRYKETNENTITIDKSDDASQNKNYYVHIPSKENNKVVVVEDMSKAKVELLIDKNIQNVTIQPNPNTPLEIVIEYQNTDDDENADQPVITIDTTSAKSAETSLKGEGQLIIQGKNEESTLNLNQIVPKKDGEIKIHSDSRVNVNQINLYGNSKVEFTNKDKKAVVNLVTLQQKASTELDNVIINGYLKAGLYSIISLTENVDIANTKIEISSNETQSSNPILIGDLRSPPSHISIQDRNVGALLEEDDVFVIAESDKNKFKCSEWVKSFDASSNSKYNHADCIDANNNMKRLIANHKDDSKGLNGGAIAGIVIAVVVVVGVVILLVYFFVIRKKKSNSYNEDDSFSSEGKEQSIHDNKDSDDSENDGA